MSFFVSHNTAKNRYEICKTCEHLNSIIKVCNQCHCFMPAKATLSNVACPLNKWGIDTPDPSIVETYHVDTGVIKADPIMSMFPPKHRIDLTPLQHQDLWINVSEDPPILNQYSIEQLAWIRLS